MRSTPKKKRGVGTALQTAELLGAYRLLSFLQAPFAWIFWALEKRIAALDIQIEKLRS
jgi:hypothetical protein